MSSKILRPSMNKQPSFSQQQLTKNQSEEIQRLSADFSILSQKFNDLQSYSSKQPVTSSSFVNNLRDITFGPNTDGSFNDTKLDVIEKILQKIIEVDRLVLRETEPEADDKIGDSTRVRRSSRGMDLFCLPTHLHVLDRLMDLFSQSQRIAIVHKNSGGPISEENGSDSAKNAEMRAQLIELESVRKKMSGQLKDCEKQLELKKNEVKSLKENLLESQNDLKKEKEKLEKQNFKIKSLEESIEEYRKKVNDRNNVASEENQSLQDKVALLTNEVSKLTVLLQDNSKNRNILEERLEVEISAQESILRAVLSISKKIQNHCDTCYISESEMIGLSPSTVKVLTILQTSVVGRLDELHSIINCISQARDAMENEVKTYSLERQLCNKDIENLTKQVSTLRCDKAVYEAELTKRHLSSSSEEVMKELERVKEENMQYRVELAAARANSELVNEHKNEISRLENMLSTLRNERIEEKLKFENEFASIATEASNYKRLCDHLKNKIKDLSSAVSHTDGKDFLLTFEEVMKEEMMSMKTAFEAKLKAAREESDETARRHQQEINRMQTVLAASPSASALMRLKNASSVNIK